MAADYLPSHQHVEAGRNYISQEVWSPGPRQVSELKQDEGRKKKLSSGLPPSFSYENIKRFNFNNNNNILCILWRYMIIC